LSDQLLLRLSGRLLPLSRGFRACFKDSSRSRLTRTRTNTNPDHPQGWSNTQLENLSALWLLRKVLFLLFSTFPATPKSLHMTSIPIPTHLIFSRNNGTHDLFCFAFSGGPLGNLVIATFRYHSPRFFPHGSSILLGLKRLAVCHGSPRLRLQDASSVLCFLISFLGIR
jgi:hypothetical protein